MDHIYRDRLKYIDIIAALDSIMSYIEGCIICERNEILDIDYRGNIVNIDLNAYFEDEFSSWDKINWLLLDPGKRLY